MIGRWRSRVAENTAGTHDVVAADVSRGESTPVVSVVLASASPRRRELMTSIGVEFIVDPADVDESVVDDESAVEYVARVSALKAQRVANRHHDAAVLAADTTVDLDGRIMTKPTDADDAVDMLMSLSDRWHRTHTGVVVRRDAQVWSQVVTTDVRFVRVTPGAARWYVDGGEPLDKAGAYAVQGTGGVFVAEISGSVSNVVGLPLAETATLLRNVGVVVAGS